MLSYQSALKVPTSEAILIIDAIDNRDAIIDGLLNRIHKKHGALITENKRLHAELDKLSTQTQIKETSEIKHDPIKSNIHTNKKGEKHLILTESTQRGYELWKTFSTHDYELESDDKNKHTRNYEELYKIIEKQGHEIKISGQTQSEQEIDTTIDSIDKEFYKYGSISKKKKFLASLRDIATDYVSDMVYVEKILERLNRIVERMNEDTTFLNKIFEGTEKKDFETGKLGIIFKGGNVYKLYTSLLNSHLDKKIFANYLREVDYFFKKSDCDFGLILIATDPKKNESRFIHLPKEERYIKLISTLQFMILNKYRNEFLGDGSTFDHLALCGKNDIIMSVKMNTMAKTMINTIITSRLENEQKLLKLITTEITFNNNNYTKHLANIIKDVLQQYNYTYENSTLLGMLENDPNLTNCISTFPIIPEIKIINHNVVEWYRSFLVYVFEDETIAKNKYFFDVSDSHLLRRPELDKENWRDIKTVYNVKQITNIVIGDYSYPILSKSASLVNDTTIYQNITSNNYPDNYAKIVSKRIKALGRLHSNRNDFFIRFAKENVLNVGIIPFDENRQFITPFYISVNKDISANSIKLTDSAIINVWLRHIDRFSTYGLSGYTPLEGNQCEKIYSKIKDRYQKTEIESMMIEFGLARLMLSMVIVCNTFDDDYFALPVPAEFIDLSYSYKRDYKTFLYEDYDGYVKFNGHLNSTDVDQIMSEYGDIIKYVNSKEYFEIVPVPEEKKHDVTAEQYQQQMITAVQQQNYDLISRDLFIKTKIRNIFNRVSDKLGPISINGEPDLAIILKIIKYYSRYGFGQNILSPIIFNSLYIPIMRSFILDLYMILFSDTKYPWEDRKYSKRIHRYIFFVFIEKLRCVSLPQIRNLLRDIGIKTKENYLKDFKKIMNINQNYQSYNSFERSYNYFRFRTDYIKDDNEIKKNEVTIESASAIDRFLFGYHLLDFFDVHQSNEHTFVRCQFIVTITNDVNPKYVLVSLNENEAKNVELAENILSNIPENITDDDETNPKEVTLPSGEKVRRYQLLSLDSQNQTIKELTKYINLIVDVREKLVITIINYVYDQLMERQNKINVVSSDTMSLLLNVYEGDINKILTVV